MKNCLGFIGGSGLYDLDFLDNKKLLEINSPWGKASDQIIQGDLNGNKIFFLPRHGKGHKISPTNINYQANIESLKQCGVTDIISLSAVGSLRDNLIPGTFVIVDQFIDRTVNRKKSFFNEGIIAHVPFSHPTSYELMKLSKDCLNTLNIKNHYGGTYLAMEGPQFSTKAESNLFRSWESDIIGMTNIPEAKLCREAEIRYCSISMVTDFDCWHPNYDTVSLDLIIQTMKENIQNSKKFIKEFSNNYYSGIDFSNDTTNNILDSSIITPQEDWDPNIEDKLNSILKRYKQNK
ncbi:MAG: S-methyl-5'-thioadenosine phosphorylase [Alphaproteobacteria bacterium MarineAlpha5_Bin9]|nr:MAG: S-methyl-5'-thioadenosine phosphorylase [Alphaproteobacteria bacterium MarineAlpha5_Bin9]|tara:strand:+ start:2933 stop:3808 length:876 start_codon:yes stop_codon:yes gene_type:complete